MKKFSILGVKVIGLLSVLESTIFAFAACLGAIKLEGQTVEWFTLTLLVFIFFIFLLIGNDHQRYCFKA